jgi:hypothetical protein
MKHRLLSTHLLGAAMMLAGNCMPVGNHASMIETADAGEGGNMVRSPSMPPARDPSAAVAEEYELARRKGTAEAFELFIARHGDDPLADKARAELKRLSR